MVRPTCSQCNSTHEPEDCPHRDVVELQGFDKQPGDLLRERPVTFECPYDFKRFGPEAILVHVRDEHPQLWPSLRTIVAGHLGYVSQRYNEPATD